MINIKTISILAIILLIAGCIENQTTIEPSKTSKSTISETSQLQEIVITLNDATKVTFIKKNYESNANPNQIPHKGYIYIIANITLKNNGYESFHLYSPELHLVYNNVSYTRISSNFYDINNVFPIRTDILNGGVLTGNILFELPENSSGYKIRYNGIEMYYDEHINYTT